MILFSGFEYIEYIVYIINVRNEFIESFYYRNSMFFYKFINMNFVFSFQMVKLYKYSFNVFICFKYFVKELL